MEKFKCFATTEKKIKGSSPDAAIEQKVFSS